MYLCGQLFARMTHIVPYALCLFLYLPGLYTPWKICNLTLILKASIFFP